MKFLLFTYLFFESFFFTNSGSKFQLEKIDTGDSIMAVKISRKFPSIDNTTGKLLGYEAEEANVFYSGDITLHELPYVYNILKILPDNVAIIDRTEIRRSYFVYRKGDVSGYFTDSSQHLNFVRYPVDSILSTYWHMQAFIEPAFDKFQIKFLESIRKESVRTDTYYFQDKIDSSQNGLLSFEFSDNFPLIDFSLCRRIDTIMGLKLVNLKILNKARFFKEHSITIDEVVQNRKVEVWSEFNVSEVEPFFKFMEKEKK